MTIAVAAGNPTRIPIFSCAVKCSFAKRTVSPKIGGDVNEVEMVIRR